MKRLFLDADIFFLAKPTSGYLPPQHSQARMQHFISTFFSSRFPVSRTAAASRLVSYPLLGVRFYSTKYGIATYS
jgi:hypothetical protein